MVNYNPDELIDFWFSDRVRKLWYNSTKEFDHEFENKFSSQYHAARDGDLDNWKSTANGCLALILLLDQYPLNVYRNKIESFATEKQALEVSHLILNQGFDTELSNVQLSFAYIPFMHSENSNDQALSVKLYENISDENFKFAKHHRDIVAKYGRFPHRNKIIGRKSTAEEFEYLSSKNGFTG